MSSAQPKLRSTSVDAAGHTLPTAKDRANALHQHTDRGPVPPAQSGRGGDDFDHLGVGSVLGHGSRRRASIVTCERCLDGYPNGSQTVGSPPLCCSGRWVVWSSGLTQPPGQNSADHRRRWSDPSGQRLLRELGWPSLTPLPTKSAWLATSTAPLMLSPVSLSDYESPILIVATNHDGSELDWRRF